VRKFAVRAILVALFSVAVLWLVQEDGGDEGDVGQVGAAEVGIVEDDDIAGLPVVEYGEGGGDAVGHGAEVGGDVGGLGDEAPGAVEEGAGEVEALFYVG